jgi:phosphatidylethanolamine-binding protein (PEBP) family uncharacterized protein
MIADDPDAPVGTWTHWLLFNLPARTATLPGGIIKVDEVPSGGRQGRNDFRKIGYGGPPARLPANPIATSSNSMPWTKCST